MLLYYVNRSNQAYKYTVVKTVKSMSVDFCAHDAAAEAFVVVMQSHLQHKSMLLKNLVHTVFIIHLQNSTFVHNVAADVRRLV